MKNKEWSRHIISLILLTMYLASPFIILYKGSEYELAKKTFIHGCVIAVAILWIFRDLILDKKQIKIGPEALTIGFFLIWSAVSLSWAKNPHVGYEVIFYWLSCYLLFIFLSNNGVMNESLIFLAIGATSIVISTIGIAQHVFSVDWFFQTVPPSVTFVHRNMAAQAVFMGLPVLFVLFFSSGNEKRAIFGWLGATVCILFIIYTGCRSVWLATITALFITLLKVGACYRASSPKKSLIKRKCAYATCSLLFIVFMTNGIDAGQTAKGPIAKKIAEAARLEGTAKGRIDAWRNLIYMIKERPLAGYGLMNTSIYYPVYHNAVKKAGYTVRRQLKYAHNELIQTGVDTGLIGVLGLSLCFIVFIFKGLKSMIGSDFYSDLYTTAIFSSIIGFLIISMFSFPFRTAMPTLYLFSYFGILLNRQRQTSDWQYTVNLKIHQVIAFALLLVVAAYGAAVVNSHVRHIAANRYYAKAFMFAKYNQWGDSLVYAGKAYRYNKQDYEIMRQYARAMYKTGDRKGAREIALLTLKKYPYSVHTLFQLAKICEDFKEDRKAIEYFQTILTIMPYSTDTLNDIGRLYYKRSEYEKSYEALRRSKKIKGQQIETIYNLSVVLREMKKYVEAAKELNDILLIKDIPEIHVELVDLYLYDLKNAKAARHHMMKYLELEPDTDISRRFKNFLSSSMASK